MFEPLWDCGVWEGTTAMGLMDSPGLTCCFSLKVHLGPVAVSSFIPVL